MPPKNRKAAPPQEVAEETDADSGPDAIQILNEGGAQCSW